MTIDLDFNTRHMRRHTAPAAKELTPESPQSRRVDEVTVTIPADGLRALNDVLGALRGRAAAVTLRRRSPEEFVVGSVHRRENGQDIVFLTPYPNGTGVPDQVYADISDIEHIAVH